MSGRQRENLTGLKGWWRVRKETEQEAMVRGRKREGGGWRNGQG